METANILKKLKNSSVLKAQEILLYASIEADLDELYVIGSNLQFDAKSDLNKHIEKSKYVRDQKR